MMYDDNYLNKWAAVYAANPALSRRHILFETFLQAPGEILQAVQRHDALLRDPAAGGPDPLPLLPAQRRVQARLDAAAAVDPPLRPAVMRWEVCVQTWDRGFRPRMRRALGC